MKVDGVAHVKDEPELTVGQGHIGDERVGLVADPTLPFRAVGPAEPPVGEHPEAARMSDRVVFLAQVREVDVAQAVRGVEHHLQRAVADHQVARHLFPAPVRVVGVASISRECSSNDLPSRSAAPS